MSCVAGWATYKIAESRQPAHRVREIHDFLRIDIFDGVLNASVEQSG